MALPRSLTQPIRQGQLNVGSGWRAFFAPFNQAYAVNQNSTSLGPTIYDLQALGKFLGNSQQPVTGWWDLGYVKNFKSQPASKIGSIVTGYRGATRAQYRAEVSEKIVIEFQEMSRMAYRIATGTQVFNLLYTSASASTSGPLNTSGTSTSAMGASGYVASGAVAGYEGQPTLYVPSGSGTLFPAGSYIVCDQDYDLSSYGYVGDAGANVYQGSVPTDVDFIRKTSDYVAGVAAVVSSGGQDALILTNPFVGGGNATLSLSANTAPTTGAKVQRVTGFAAREGGSKIVEWSAIFVMDTVDASQFLFYYPRISPDQFSGFSEQNLQNASSLLERGLQTSFNALAFDDPLDGETVVAYKAYYPHSGVSLGI